MLRTEAANVEVSAGKVQTLQEKSEGLFGKLNILSCHRAAVVEEENEFVDLSMRPGIILRFFLRVSLLVAQNRIHINTGASKVLDIFLG